MASAKKAKRAKSKARPKAKSKPKSRAKSKPARKLVAKTKVPRPSGPPPPPPDAVEMSGIYERVMVSERDPNQEVREIFSHYDRDKNGAIELPEFARICEAAGMAMEEDELATGYAIVDTDADGKISWDEFVGWWSSLGR